MFTSQEIESKSNFKKEEKRILLKRIAKYEKEELDNNIEIVEIKN